MKRKILIFLIVFLAALLLTLGLEYIFKKPVEAPQTGGIQENGFRGPTGQPYVKGPTGPHP